MVVILYSTGYLERNSRAELPPHRIFTWINRAKSDSLPNYSVYTLKIGTGQYSISDSALGRGYLLQSFVINLVFVLLQSLWSVWYINVLEQPWQVGKGTHNWTCFLQLSVILHFTTVTLLLQWKLKGKLGVSVKGHEVAKEMHIYKMSLLLWAYVWHSAIVNRNIVSAQYAHGIVCFLLSFLYYACFKKLITIIIFKLVHKSTLWKRTLLA